MAHVRDLDFRIGNPLSRARRYQLMGMPERSMGTGMLRYETQSAEVSGNRPIFPHFQSATPTPACVIRERERERARGDETR